MNLETMPLDRAVAHALAGATTATLTTVLLKKGLRTAWVRRPFAASGPGPDHWPRLHAALRAGAGRPGHAGKGRAGPAIRHRFMRVQAHERATQRTDAGLTGSRNAHFISAP